MKILICLDSFKGSFTNQKGTEVVGNIFRKYFPESEIFLFPIADGGEGSIDILKEFIGGKFVYVMSSDPLGRRIKTKYLKKGETAYIELAKQAGIILLKKEELNPLETTTYGVGEVIRQTVYDGCKNIKVFVGGSATNDAGIGALTAMGVNFFDSKGRKIFPGKGKDLINIKKLDISEVDKRFFKVRITILSDVKNPLYGKNGAAWIYASQKGADQNQIEFLDKGLRSISKVFKKFSGRDINKVEGTGAAGGFAAGFISIFNAEVKSGIKFIFKKGGFYKILRKSNFVITGEGKVDKQSLYGKVVGNVVKNAEKYKIPVIIFAGMIDNEFYRKFKKQNIAILSINPPFLSYEEAMKNGLKYLKIKAEQIARIIKFAQKSR